VQVVERNEGERVVDVEVGILVDEARLVELGEEYLKEQKHIIR